MNALLETHQLTACYDDFQALFGIDFNIISGETVAIIGSNGAGKSTFLKSISGLIKNRTDSILFEGNPIGANPPYDIVRKGITMVPERP